MVYQTSALNVVQDVVFFPEEARDYSSFENKVAEEKDEYKILRDASVRRSRYTKRRAG